MITQTTTARSQEQRDSFRARFLLACYQKFGAAQAWENDGGLIAVGLALADELGVEAAEAHEAYLYLAKRGLITTTQAGGGRLTADGQDAAERMLRELEAAHGTTGRKIGFETT